MPIERDKWFDGEGNMDFEEVQEDLSFASDMAGMAQRAATNRLLREQAAERKRIASLPDCIYCGGKLPKIGVVLCMHCKGKLDWVGEIVCPPNPEGRKLAKVKWDEVCRRREEKKRAEAWRLAQAQKKYEEFGEGCGIIFVYIFLTLVGLFVTGAVAFLTLNLPFWLAGSSFDEPSNIRGGAFFRVGGGAFFTVLIASVPALTYLLMRRDGFKQLRIRDQSGWGGILVYCCFPAIVCGSSLSLVLYPPDPAPFGLMGTIVLFFVFWAIYNRVPNWLPKLAAFYHRVASIKIELPPLSWLPKAEETEVSMDQDYWIKRGDEPHGPFSVPSLVEAATHKQLKKGDLLGNSKDGPWQQLTKELLQKMNDGVDVEIK